jgi:hypothetical protein
MILFFPKNLQFSFFTAIQLLSEKLNGARRELWPELFLMERTYLGIG